HYSSICSLIISCYLFFYFFFNDTAITEIYTLSLHDALPILSKTDALDEEKWLNMLGTFVKDWFKYESHFVHGRDSYLNQSLTNVDRKSGSAGMPRPISYAVFCLKKKKTYETHIATRCSHYVV